MSLPQRVSQLLPKLVLRFGKRGGRDTARWLWSHADAYRRERRLGIDTTECVSAAKLGYPAEAVGYEPINYACLDAILDSLEIDPTRDVFVDIGAGRGRAVIAAATYPFKRVVGIEIHEELVADCRRQVERARRHFACPDIEVAWGDAVAYAYPQDMSVAFLWNPFNGATLDRVLEKIRASQAAFPRPMQVFYSIPENAPDELEDRGWLKDRREIPTRFWTGIRILRYVVDAEGAVYRRPGAGRNTAPSG